MKHFVYFLQLLGYKCEFVYCGYGGIDDELQAWCFTENE
jgi:hypothetical protein